MNTNPEVEWIRMLLQERTSEAQTLEFKRELPARNDKGRNDFLSDVTSLANARGGRIIFGISEDADGRAEAAAPILESEDEVSLRLHSILLSGVEPRIEGLEIISVPWEDGALCIVHVPPQFGGPFEAASGTWRRFKIRHGRKTEEMSYRELADAFGRRSSIEAKVRTWRLERLSQFRKEIALQIFTSRCWTLFHILPISSFAGSCIDLHAVKNNRCTFRGYDATGRFNLDGLRFTLGTDQGPVTEFIQFFRNGAIEIGWTRSAMDAKEVIHSLQTAVKLLHNTASAIRALRGIGLAGPGLVGLSIVNGMHHSLRTFDGDEAIDSSETIRFPEVPLEDYLVDDLSTLPRELEGVASQVMDELFQAFGEDRCNFFDTQGRLFPRFRARLQLPDVWD